MRSPDRLPDAQVTAADWRMCRDIAREHGRTFYLASRLLPPARRCGILAAYAYCRVADDLVDRALVAADGDTAATIDRWETELAEPNHPVARAFAATRATFGVPEQPVRDLLTGIRIDLAPTRFETWPALRTYCHLVAGTVGLIVAPILGCRDAGALNYAAELGIAMQLTNILRDIAEDARMGRLYLPLDDIARFGCDPDAILAGEPGKRFPDLMAFEIERARDLYARAMHGVPSLCPSGRLATLAASRLYAGILGEIERMDCDVFRGRARVPARRKVGGLGRVMVTFTRMSFAPVHEAGPGSPLPGTPIHAPTHAREGQSHD
jgi:phytoene synthase